MKYGLKLWSTNDFYINEAVKLYKNKVYDYIELFVVPNSLKYLILWEKLTIPFILHAPHSYTGFNPSLEKYEGDNLKLLSDVESYRKTLNPEYIIFHPGIDGQLSETIRQFNIFKETYEDIFSIALIENKPAVGIKGEKCVGVSVCDISRIMKNTSMGFCYDIGHSICYSNSININWREIFLQFLKLNPNLYHLSDGEIGSTKDMHLNLGSGDYDLRWITDILPQKSRISIETQKHSQNNLNCFLADIDHLRKLL